MALPSSQADLHKASRWWRSPWFCFGWPGLIGLLWGWLAFTNDHYEVSWVTEKGRSFQAGGGDGSFYALHRQLLGDERDGTDEGLNWRWLPDRWEGEGCVFMRKPYVFFFGDESAGHTRELDIAAWAAVLAYLVAWGGLVTAWRIRRLRGLRPLKEGDGGFFAGAQSRGTGKEPPQGRGP